MVSAAYWGLVGAALRWERRSEFRAFVAKSIHLAITEELARHSNIVIGGRRQRGPMAWDHDSTAHNDAWYADSPLDTLVAKEERVWLRGAIKRLTPARRRVIQNDLRGKPTLNGEDNRWKAVKQLRAML